MQDTEGVPCELCGVMFPSRNKMFKHIRDRSNTCGSISTGDEVGVPYGTHGPSKSDEKRDKLAALEDHRKQSQGIEAEPLATKLPPKKRAKKAPRNRTLDFTSSEDTELWLGGIPAELNSVKKVNSALWRAGNSCVDLGIVKYYEKRGYKQRNDAGQKRWMGYVFIAFRSAADRDAAIEFFDGREICEGFIGKAKKAVYRKSKGKANKKEPTRKDDGEKIESTNTEVNTWYGLPQMSLWGAWEGVSRWWWGDWKGENGTSRSLQTGGNGNGNGTNICRNGAGCGLMKGNTEPNTCECEQDRAQHENLRKQHREKGRRDAQDALTDSISDQDDENKFGTRSGSTDANAKGVSGSGNSTTDILGSDPPLLSQLRPLDDLQLIERIRVLGLGAPERYATTRMLMEQLAEYYTEHPRTEVHVQGKSVPAHLLQGCLTSLDSMAWPPKRERRKVKADHYVVINMTKHYKDEYTPRVREACKALMDEMAPEYAFTHIAVTKNFVGSPHKDVLDTSFQFAISLGSFTDGGQLCVENTAGKCEGGTELFVVDTHNKLAKCDGRFIHWVRSYGGGDRYSLIFFTNSVQMSTPKTCAVFPNES